MRTFEQYFTFWFLHFVNCGEPSYVCIVDKDNYIQTMGAAKLQSKPIEEKLSVVMQCFREVNKINS